MEAPDKSIPDLPESVRSRVPGTADAAGDAIPVSVLAAAMFLLAACTPRVELAASKEPITINLNVKIEHEIRIKVEKDLEDVLSKESGLF